MKKKWLKFVVIAAIIIGVGGVIIMHIRSQDEEPSIQEVEEMSVNALKKTFKEIESVEFVTSRYNNMTGSYYMIVEITSQNGKSVEFDYSFAVNLPDEIAGWEIVDEENVQMAGETTSQVSVTYSDGSIGVV